jgi:hypothetical protein
MGEETDGLAVVNTNELPEPMRRIIADSSSYYLLGYQSSNARLDGKFRSIKVTVKRPNVQVRARRGYRAASAADVRAVTAAASAAPRPDDAVTRAFTSVISASTPVPIRVRASGWTRTAVSGTESLLWVVGELDAATRKDPSWTPGARAEVVVVGVDGRQAARKNVDLPAGALTTGTRVLDAGAMQPGDYDVRVGVRPTSGGSPINETVRVALTETPSPLGEAVMFRRGPSTGTRYLETADPRFARNERLRLELPASSGSAEARIVDRAGKPTQVPTQMTTRPDPSGTFQWIVVEVVLAPFAAGDYAVVVTLDGTSQITGFRVGN